LDKAARWILSRTVFSVSVVDRDDMVLCVERQRLAVVGVGKGTKKLNDFLDCTKVRVVDRCFFTQANTLIGVSYDVLAGVRDRYVR
jgi:hypothetical protein